MARRDMLIATRDRDAVRYLRRALGRYDIRQAIVDFDYDIESLAQRGFWPSVIFVDLTPPAEGARALIDAARERWPSPIVGMGEAPDAQDLTAAVNQGMIAFITLPMNREPTEALRGVARVVARGERETEDPFARADAWLERIRRDIDTDAVALPETPQVLIQLREALHKDSAAVADAVRLDAEIAARVLRLANASATKRGKPFENLVDAVSQVGHLPIRSLVYAVIVRRQTRLIRHLVAPLAEPSWSLYLTTACAARCISDHLGLSKKAGEDAYLAALVHRIGELVILRYFSDPQVVENQQPSIKGILRVMRAEHAEYGARLLERWLLGERFVEVARRAQDAIEFFAPWPEDETRPSGETRRLAYIVALANRLADGVGPDPWACAGPSWAHCCDELGIDRAQRETLQRATHDLVEDMRRLLEVDA